MRAKLPILAAAYFILLSGFASGNELSSRPGANPEPGRPLAIFYNTGIPVDSADSSSRVFEQPAGPRDKVPSIGSYAKNFFPDLLYGTERIFAKDNIPLAVIGFGAAALALTVDRDVSDYFKRAAPLSQGVMDAANTIGNGYVELGLGAALAGTGELINDRRMADAGVVSLEAFVINLGFTETLKLITHRARPNRGNNHSFPAGHASTTAAFAASVSEMYDWNPWLAAPLYLTTAYVGVARIQAQEHYLSDVIAGITLGTLAGSSVGKYHKEKNSESRAYYNISFSPIFQKDLRGCLITLLY